MSQYSIARRYSGALFQAAGESGSLASVETDFSRMSEFLKPHSGLFSLISNPLVSNEEKKAVFGKAFPTLNPLTSRFIGMIIEKKREHQLPEIITQFFALSDEKNGIARAAVTTAIDLSPEQEKRLMTEINKLTGKNVILTKHLNPEIKGGMVLRIGDTVYNTSITHRLDLIRKNLLK